MGAGGEVQKKYSPKGKLNEKNSCTPINPKKYSCYSLKKIHTRNLITKKNSCGSKIPHSPHNFSNGPFLTRTSTKQTAQFQTHVDIVTALFTNMRALKFKSQLIIAFFADVNHLNGPLRKQNFTSTRSIGHGLWFAIGGFRSVLYFKVRCLWS